MSEARSRHCLVALIAAVFSWVVASQGVGAQEGIPPFDLATPAPAECTVTPRGEEELRALFHEAEAIAVTASPVVIPIATLPAGTPADAETLAAINATWREFIACINAGDQARMFALYSDDMVRRQFVVDIAFGVTEEALFEFLAATPVPQTGEWAAVFVPLEDARVLSDQRVAVVQTYEEAPDEVRIFVKEGDRWLMDEGYELS